MSSLSVRRSTVSTGDDLCRARRNTQQREQHSQIGRRARRVGVHNHDPSPKRNSLGRWTTEALPLLLALADCQGKNDGLRLRLAPRRREHPDGAAGISEWTHVSHTGLPSLAEGAPASSIAMITGNALHVLDAAR